MILTDSEMSLVVSIVGSTRSNLQAELSHRLTDTSLYIDTYEIDKHFDTKVTDDLDPESLARIKRDKAEMLSIERQKKRAYVVLEVMKEV